ncbi:MAG: hypothetical protein QOE70_3371 [Chthoniobacter sp.]|nr:hypothetical protein [Chthoniobacter sp.]
MYTDFEGGSARIESVDRASRVIRFLPAGDPQRGWPCWWSIRVDGVAKGERLILDLGGSDLPARNNGEETGKPLAASWAMPERAAVSTDGTTWLQTEPGHRDGARMRYEVTGTGDPLWIAWGPPFTPQDTDVLLAEAERTIPEVKAFELARSREGRVVRGLRVSESAPGQGPALWIQARQHAWESGASWVARGLIEWLISTDLDATWLRQHAELFIVPIMDVDNVATGNGGKEENPRDHNRDWDVKPVYPEVAAAQQRLLAFAEAGRLALFVDLHNPAPGDMRPFFFTSSPDVLGELARQNQAAFLALAAQTINGPLAVEPTARLTGPKYHPLWQQISNAWVNTHGNPQTVAVCLETAWNTPHSSTEGYRTVGRQLGRTVVEYLRRRP